jgi:transcriptional regulator with XRE-family HTH domain
MKIQVYDYKPIGSRIKEARLALRYTQEYVAEKIGVGNKHISDIERGFAGLSISVLMKLCDVLEVDSDYILFGKITETKNNNFNNILKKLTVQQRMYAEKFVALYAESCRDAQS